MLRIGGKAYDIDLTAYYRLWVQEKVPILTELYGAANRSVVLDNLDVVVSMIAGNPAWVVTPENQVTDELFSRLWLERMDALVDEAIRHFLVAGYGGVAFTPIGIEVVHPLNCVAVPDVFQPDIYVVVKPMEVSVAKQLFGRYRAIDQNAYEAGSPNSPTALFRQQRTTAHTAYAHSLVDVYMVYNGAAWRFYVNNQLVGGEEFEARSFETVFLLLGERRHPSVVTRSGRNKDGLPISMVEKLTGTIADNDLNVAQELEHVMKALVALAKRQSLLFVRKGAVVDERMVALLENNYRVVWVSDTEGSLETTDKVTFADLQIALQVLQEQLISRTGVSAYQRGLPSPGVNLATEAALLQANSNVRIQRTQTMVLLWLTMVAGAFRDYLIDMPADNQTVVDIVADGVTYSFGPHNPYAGALAGYNIRPASGGFSDIMQRRQELLGALQAVMAAPDRYDIGRLTDSLLMTYRINPSAVKLSEQEAFEMVPFQPETEEVAT